MKTYRRMLWIAALCLGACAPRPDVPAKAATKEAEAEPALPPGVIDLPANVRQNLGIRFASVEVREVARTMRLAGTFELDPRARESYRLSLDGQVQLLVDELEAVEAGQPLFRFQSPGWLEIAHEILTAQQRIGTSKAELGVLEATLIEAREQHRLASERAASVAEARFKDAELEQEVARLAASFPRLEAEIALARQRLTNAEQSREHALHHAATVTGLHEHQLEEEIEVDGHRLHVFQSIEWIEVVARRGGVVERLALGEGAYAERSALVLTTIEPDRLRFRAQAAQADLPRLARLERGRIVPALSPGAEALPPLEARLRLGVDPIRGGRQFPIVALPLGGADWARAGVTAFLEVVLEGDGRPSFAIPSDAVVQDGLEHVFFRRSPKQPSRVMRVVADLGVDDGRWVEIASGVGPGDEVVVDGAYELQLATQTGGRQQKGGHFHSDGSFHEEH